MDGCQTIISGTRVEIPLPLFSRLNSSAPPTYPGPLPTTRPPPVGRPKVRKHQGGGRLKGSRRQKVRCHWGPYTIGQVERSGRKPWTKSSSGNERGEYRNFSEMGITEGLSRRETRENRRDRCIRTRTETSTPVETGVPEL